MKKVLDGIEEMKRLPGAIFIVDIKKEQIAVKEAKKLNIPIFAIVDTNSDPTIIDFPIPANDDAAKSISIISRTVADAVVEGSQKIKEQQAEQQAVEQAEEKPEMKAGKSVKSEKGEKPEKEVKKKKTEEASEKE